MIMILPLFNPNYGYLLRGRYVMPLLPILYCAVAAMGVASFERLHRSTLNQRRRSLATAQLGQACLGLLLAFVVVHPVHNLHNHYEEVWDHGRSNAPIYETFEQIKRHGRDGEVVIIDGFLDYWNYREENRWRVASILRILLDIDGTPYRMVDLGRSSELTEPRNRCRDQLVIVGSRDLNANREIVAKFQLRDLDHGPATPQTRPGRYRLYRLDRLPEAPPSC
jgi:hypothetical protein